MIFTRDFVTRENYWQIASLVTQKSLFTVTHASFFISYRIQSLDTNCEIALRWVLQNLTHKKSELVQVLPWCHQLTAITCINKLTIIGSGHGFSAGWCQAIIWTNAGILVIGPLGTHFSEPLIKIYTFSFKKMHLKMPSGKWWLFCLGLNMLIVGGTLQHLFDSVINQNSSWGNSGSHHFQLNALVVVPQGMGYTEWNHRSVQLLSSN